MQVTVTARHIVDHNKTENLRKYILKKVKRLEKYINPHRDPSEIKFVLDVEKFRNTAELILNSGSLNATSSVEADDMLSAIDKAIESTIKQLKKQSEKMKKVKRRKNLINETRFDTITAKSIEDIDTIKVKKLPKKPMSVEEALLQLKASKTEFIVFTNSETGEINTLLKEKGGKLVLIIP